MRIHKTNRRSSLLLIIGFLFMFFPVFIWAVFCPKCGIENTDDSRFCKSCGLKIFEIVDYLSKVGDPVKKGFLNRIKQDRIQFDKPSEKEIQADSMEKEEIALPEKRNSEETEKTLSIAESDKIQEIIRQREAVADKTPEKKSFYSTFPGDDFFEYEEKEMTSEQGDEEKVLQADKKIEAETMDALAQGKSKSETDDEEIDFTANRDRKKPENTKNKTMMERMGNIELLLVYNGVDFDKYQPYAKIYLNNYYIGNATPSQAEKKNLMEAVNSNLFGTRGSDLFTKKYFVFQKKEVPAGIYQLKASLREKGFIIRKTWTKKWKDVTVKEGEKTRIIYKWSDIKEFGS